MRRKAYYEKPSERRRREELKRKLRQGPPGQPESDGFCARTIELKRRTEPLEDAKNAKFKRREKKG